MAKGLAHAQIVEDSTPHDVAGADYLLMFRKKGDNKVPVAHPTGLQTYAGERVIPHELQTFKNWAGNQIENRYSHWIWRAIRVVILGRYSESTTSYPTRKAGRRTMSCPRPSVAIGRVIERAVVPSRQTPGEIVSLFLTPFLGVGSEVSRGGQGRS